MRPRPRDVCADNHNGSGTAITAKYKIDIARSRPPPHYLHSDKFDRRERQHEQLDLEKKKEKKEKKKKGERKRKKGATTFRVLSPWQFQIVRRNNTHFGSVGATKST